MVRHWRPDGRTSATSNFHIRLCGSGPRGMNVRTSILQHAISIFVMHASGPWEADVWTVIFELPFLPYLWARQDGVSIFPYSELGKNLKLIDHWWTSGRAAEMSGRMQAGTEASRYSGGSERMMLVCLASGRDEHVVRTDGTVDRWTSGQDDTSSGQDDTSSGQLTGNLKSSIFFAVQSLLKMLLQVESLFTTSLHISDFVQTQNEAKILTNSPFGHFGTKITWPVWKYILGPNQKLLPFLSQRDKG
jgi:hypothetical protein